MPFSRSKGGQGNNAEMAKAKAISRRRRSRFGKRMK
jgi:hypothetical protein